MVPFRVPRCRQPAAASFSGRGDHTSSEASLRETITIIHPAAAGERIATAIGRLAEPAEDRPLVDLLALLAAGRFDRVTPVTAGGGAAPAGIGTAGLAALRPVEEAVLVARFAAWTGQLAVVAGAWQRIRPAIVQALDAGVAGLAGLPYAAAMAALERVATDLGDPMLAARLHGAATRGAAAGGRAGAVPTADPMAQVLAAALDPLSTPPLPPTPGMEAARLADAAAIIDFVHGTLGIEPDATRNRIRLQPRLTPACPTLHVRDIGFADAVIGLECVLQPDSLVVRITQDAGAIPLTALLEPVLPAGTRPLHCRVDGTPASLAPRPVAGGMAVPVQLVLDAGRELRLELDARRPPTEAGGP